jgi:mRNA-degrading endonuclease toxin of MazEF toxin-antitoxin module
VPPDLGPRRGDIHIVDFPRVGGHVMQGPHPAVVVSSDRLNRPVGTVLVCSMTSKIRHDPAEYLPPYLVAAPRQASGLDRDGFVKVDQVFTCRVELLGARIGRLNPEATARLSAALRFVLAL